MKNVKIRKLLVMIVIMFLFSACTGSAEEAESNEPVEAAPVETAEESSEGELMESDVSEVTEDLLVGEDVEEVLLGDDVQDEINIDDPNTVLTIENCEELKDLLEGEADLDKQAAFVEKYEGRIIEFNALVLYIAQDPDYKTIYTYVLVPGEDTEHFGTTLFLLERISAIFDFHWDKETRPDSLVVGSGIRIQAEVVTGNNPRYIYLRPTYTWGR